jgi:hypothetical protein
MLPYKTSAVYFDIFPVHQSDSSLSQCHETYEVEETSLNEIRNNKSNNISTFIGSNEG